MPGSDDKEAKKAATSSQHEQADRRGQCDTACDLAGYCSPTKSWTWFGAETLLWFGQKQDSPPLIATAPMTQLPNLNNPNTSVRFGGEDSIDYGLIPGYRISGGTYLDECQKFAIGGRIYGIYPDKSTFAIASGTGDPSIGVPFFDADPFVMDESAYLVSYHDGTQLHWGGEARARADLDMFGTDGSLHMLLARSHDHRVDLIGGYTYNKLDTSIDLRTTRTNFFTGDLIPDGTVFNTTDVFEAENEFNGGHLGIVSSVVRRRLTLTTLLKVSFGNMHQFVAVNGLTEQIDPSNTTTTSAGGIFARPTNIGTTSRDRFAFIPELGVKGAFAIDRNVQLTAGYTFMYWSDVVLAGEQMSRIIDTSGASALPGPTGATGSYWMQGIDLGLNIAY